MSKAFITDYIEIPDIERAILGEQLSSAESEAIEVLLVWHQHVDAEYMARFPKLRGVVRYGVGYDNVDLNSARERNVVVCNTPDYGTDEVSDTALAMLMNTARGLSRYDYLSRSYTNDWQEHTLTTIKRTSEVLLGVVGAGRIGGSVLLKAKACGFQTALYDPYQPRGYEKMLGAMRYDSLDECLANSDVISIHTPLNDETAGMVDDRFILCMKSGASLINTARGKILSEIDVLYEPLRRGHLNCVGLDVLPDEPPKDSKLINAWRKCENWLDGRLIINPHTGYYSKSAFVEMREKAAKNALRILRGETPYNMIY